MITKFKLFEQHDDPFGEEINQFQNKSNFETIEKLIDDYPEDINFQASLNYEGYSLYFELESERNEFIKKLNDILPRYTNYGFDDFDGFPPGKVTNRDGDEYDYPLFLKI